MQNILNTDRISFIKSNLFFKEMLKPVIEFADSYDSEKINSLPYSKFKLFHLTGNRKEYEAIYFHHRRLLNAYAALYIIYGTEKYKTDLENIIWAVCDEYTWALPAHLGTDADLNEQQTHIELFAAETGGCLAEILSMTKESLSQNVVDRAVFELRRRIIYPYLSRDFTWKRNTNNWAAVCTTGVALTFLYCAKENEIKQVIPEFIKSIEYFLSGYHDDGCCVEGISYWTYGFGFFVYLAERLSTYTDGNINLFNSPVAKKAIYFPQNIQLGKNHCISFSDGNSDLRIQFGLISYLRDNFAPKMTFSDIIFSNGKNMSSQWFSFIRNFAWGNPECIGNNTASSKVTYYDNAQWYIKNENACGFAAKCGHNDEHHNHNDVGSFSCVFDDKIILADLGAGEYTKQYFTEGRYSILVLSSRGHSVPVIDGQYQKSGKEFCGSVLKADNNTFEIEFSGAYGINSLKKLKRTFMLSKSGFTLSDSFLFNTNSHIITERFVTTTKPQITQNGIIIDNALIKAAGNYKLDTYYEYYPGHNGVQQTAYFIDFTIHSDHKDASFTLSVNAL